MKLPFDPNIKRFDKQSILRSCDEVVMEVLSLYYSFQCKSNGRSYTNGAFNIYGRLVMI